MRALFAVLLMSVAGGVGAEEAPAASESSGAAVTAAKPDRAEALKQWFRNWKAGLERSAVEARYRRVRGTAVAAVRGAGQQKSDPSRPYWKNALSEKKAAERRKERDELAAAVELLLAGKLDAGAKALDDFEAAHPQSLLLSEVREARVKLAELRGDPPPAAAPKPAAQAPDKKSAAGEKVAAEEKPAAAEKSAPDAQTIPSERKTTPEKPASSDKPTPVEKPSPPANAPAQPASPGGAASVEPTKD